MQKVQYTNKTLIQRHETPIVTEYTLDMIIPHTMTRGRKPQWYEYCSSCSSLRCTNPIMINV